MGKGGDGCAGAQRVLGPALVPLSGSLEIRLPNSSAQGGLPGPGWCPAGAMAAHLKHAGRTSRVWLVPC